MHPRHTAAPIVLGAALLLAGCGGNDASAGTSDASATTKGSAISPTSRSSAATSTGPAEPVDIEGVNFPSRLGELVLLTPADLAKMEIEGGGCTSAGFQPSYSDLNATLTRIENEGDSEAGITVHAAYYTRDLDKLLAVHSCSEIENATVSELTVTTYPTAAQVEEITRNYFGTDYEVEGMTVKCGGGASGAAALRAADNNSIVNFLLGTRDEKKQDEPIEASCTTAAQVLHDFGDPA